MNTLARTFVKDFTHPVERVFAQTGKFVGQRGTTRQIKKSTGRMPLRHSLHVNATMLESRHALKTRRVRREEQVRKPPPLRYD